MRPLAGGLISHPMHELAGGEFETSAAMFTREMRSLLDKWRPDVICAERFMVRGRFNGASAEKVSLMIGITYEMARRRDIRMILISSATWKNSIQRLFDRRLEELYGMFKPLPPHVIDAHLQAVFGIKTVAGVEGRDAFSGWKIQHLRELRRMWLRNRDRR